MKISREEAVMMQRASPSRIGQPMKMKNGALPVVFIVIASALSGPASAFAQNVDEISGRFDDGTYWVATKPENWNGTLLLKRLNMKSALMKQTYFQHKLAILFMTRMVIQSLLQAGIYLQSRAGLLIYFGRVSLPELFM